MGKTKENVFHKELEIVNRAKDLVNDPDTTPDLLAEEYHTLANHYDKLLKETKVLTSVSDRLHHKLSDANTQLTKQKDEIGEINEELTTNNQVLQDTINELIKASPNK